MEASNTMRYLHFPPSCSGCGNARTKQFRDRLNVNASGLKIE